MSLESMAFYLLFTVGTLKSDPKPVSPSKSSLTHTVCNQVQIRLRITLFRIIMTIELIDEILTFYNLWALESNTLI